MSFIHNVENIVKKQGDNGLIYLEKYYGLRLELYREDTLGDRYSDAYGSSSGSTASKIGEFKGVLQGDDFIQKSDHFSGNFEEGFLYTRNKNILANDIIKIKNTEGVSRKYKVESIESIGYTTKVFNMYKLSNLGE